MQKESDKSLATSTVGWESKSISPEVSICGWTALCGAAGSRRVTTAILAAFPAPREARSRVTDTFGSEFSSRGNTHYR